MVEMVLLLALGLLSDAYGVMVGAGGGFVFVPALLLLLKLPPEIAAGTGLVVVFLNSISGSMNYIRQKRVHFSISWPIIFGSIPGTFIGTWLLGIISPDFFYWIFAAALFMLGMFLLLKKAPEEPEHSMKAGFFNEGRNRLKAVFLFIIGLLLGTLSNFFGIGGGWLLVPILIYLLKIRPHDATAISLFALSIYSLVGALNQIALGNVNWTACLWGGIGVMIGSQLGAILSTKVPGKWILQMLSFLLIGVSMKLFLSV